MPEKYDYIRATITDGKLGVKYRVTGNPTPGRTDHDEDVLEWSDKEIRGLVASLIDVQDDQRELIEIFWA